MIMAQVNAQTVITLVTVLLGGSFVMALIAAFKARPERDGVLITNTQNAAEMLRGTNEALYADWQREHQRRVEAEAALELMEQRAETAEAKVIQLTAALKTREP